MVKDESLIKNNVGNMIDAPKKFFFEKQKSSFGGNSFQAAKQTIGLNGVRKNPINNAGLWVRKW